MKPFSMNLSKVKKISGDKNHSVFQHPDGHKITVAHAALSPSHRMQMMKLPVQRFDVGGRPSVPGPIDSYDDVMGPPVPDSQSQPAAMNNPNVQMGPEIDETSGVGKELVDSADQENQDIDQDNDTTPAADTVTNTQPVTSPQDAYSRMQDIADKATPVFDKYLTNGESPYIGQANDLINRAVGNADPNEDLNLTHLYDAPNKARDADGHVMSYRQRGQAIQNALDTHKIDYNSVLGDANGHIAGAIGLILGGAGGRGNGNLALDTLNNRVAQAVQSQKNSNEQTMNLWHMNQQAYQNDYAATAATQELMLRAAASKLQDAAAQNNNLQTKNAAVQGLLGINQLKNQYESIKGYQTFFGGAQGPKTEEDYNHLRQMSMIGNPPLADSMAKAQIPSIGYSTNGPIDDKTKEAVMEHTNMANILQKANAFQTRIGHGTVALNRDDAATAQDLSNQITLSAGKMFGLNRINEQEFNAYKEMAGQIGALNWGGPLKHIQNLQQLNASKYQTLLQQHAIHLFDGAAAPNASLTGAGQFKDGQVVRLNNGKKVQMFPSKGKYLPLP